MSMPFQPNEPTESHELRPESPLPGGDAVCRVQPVARNEADPWLDTRFTLRAELKFDSRCEDDKSFVVIEDPVRSKYFQIGPREYRFVASIDGKKTPREIGRLLNGNLAESESDYDDELVTQICQWLVQSNLVFGESIDNAKRLNNQANALKRSQLLGSFNPICIKFKLFNPNTALMKIQPYAQWLFSTWFLVVWCAAAIYTLIQVYSHWEHLGSASAGILSGYSWIWLLLIWIGLKVIHEAAHGIACRRYGGEVPEAGVLLLLFTPMAYVNVTSMWRFPNRWHRIVVSAAGMYVELFISFLAFFVWTRTTGVIANVAFNVFLMSSVTTILFNANPLMRFDGYFLLSDLLKIPNLYPKGTRWFGDRIKSLLFGIPKTPNICTDAELRRVAIYGSMAFFWKISISISLIIGAGVLFHGLGLILSGIGATLWIALPIHTQIKSIFGQRSNHRVNPYRTALSFTVIGLFGLSLFGILKAPATKSAPAIVQFAEETLLRADADGFIKELLVMDGENVVQGQRLLVLENPSLANDVLTLERRAEEAKIQYRIYKQQKELSLAMAELKTHEELNEQLAEKREEADGLVVLAPFDGFVFQRNLENKIGSFAKRGDPLLTIAQRQTKEVVVSIDQRDLESVQDNEGEMLRVIMPGISVFQSKLIRVNPSASQTPTHLSLCAQAGGPLDVHHAMASGNLEEPGIELLSPRFNVFLELDAESSRRLQSGQRGRAFFSTCEQSLGSYIYLAVADWLDKKIEIATRSATF